MRVPKTITKTKGEDPDKHYPPSGGLLVELSEHLITFRDVTREVDRSNYKAHKKRVGRATEQVGRQFQSICGAMKESHGAFSVETTDETFQHSVFVRMSKSFRWAT